jgi:hypothetical protein
VREAGTRPLIGAGPPVLRRAGNISAERVGGVPCPARVVEKGAGECHAIGAAVRDDRFRLMGIDDHPDRLHGDAARLFDRGGERYLVAGREVDTRLRAAARAGAKATILHEDQRPLAHFDRDLVERVLDKSRRVGIDIRLGSGGVRIRAKGSDANEPVEASMVVHGVTISTLMRAASSATVTGCG